MICRICNKPLVGLINEYGNTWVCSDCYEDKQSVLSCETGCKVKAINLKNGYDCESKQALKYLKQDEVYTSKQVIVGGYHSTIELVEIPNQKFNTVHFIRV